MKKPLLFILSAAISVGIAQNPVPNPGFENYSGTNPVGWYASAYAGCTISNQAHSGTNALKMAPWGSSKYGAIAYTPASGQAFHLNGFIPSAFTGWYISNFSGGDQLEIVVTVYSGGSATGSGFAFINTNASTYTQFSVAINNPGTADSARIQLSEITSAYGTSGLNAASYVIIDDLAFDGVMGIENHKTGSNGLGLFPNPVNSGILHLSLAKNYAAGVISIASADGKEVLKTSGSVLQQAGNMIDVGHLAKGIYFLTVSSAEGVEVKKLYIAE